MVLNQHVLALKVSTQHIASIHALYRPRGFWWVTSRVTFAGPAEPAHALFRSGGDSLGPTGMHQRGSARATDGVLFFRIFRGWVSAEREVGMRPSARPRPSVEYPITRRIRAEWGVSHVWHA